MNSQDKAEAAIQAEFATYVATIAAGFSKPLQASLEDTERQMLTRIREQRDASALADQQAREGFNRLTAAAHQEVAQLSSLVAATTTDLATSRAHFEEKVQLALQSTLQRELEMSRSQVETLNSSVNIVRKCVYTMLMLQAIVIIAVVFIVLRAHSS